MSKEIRFGKDSMSLRSKGIKGLVPIKPGSKAAIKGWPDAVNWDTNKISKLTFECKGHGIGLVSGSGIAALDIDILDEEQAKLVADIFRKTCGHTPFIRVGSYPKTAWFYRGPDIPYIKHPFGLPIEVFGGLPTKQASGQIVLHGIHAKTGVEYNWPHQNFMDIDSIEEIPVLDKDKLYLALRTISEHPDLQSLKRQSTMSGSVDIGLDGINMNTARAVWESGENDPMILAEWMNNAEEGTRHATMLAALNFLHSNEFSECYFGRHIASLNEKQYAIREDVIEEVYKAFRAAKPESAAKDEFLRASQWIADHVETPAVRERQQIIDEFGPADIEDLEPAVVGIDENSSDLFGSRDKADSYGHGPDELVSGLMYKDVSLLAGPGGSHKTTLVIYEAIQSSLGKDIWGRQCAAPFKTLFVSHEDEQTTIFGKIARILAQNDYSEEEQDEVWRSVGVLYVGKRKFKLCRVVDDVVENNTTTMKEVVKMIREFGFERVVFDPAISFGIGETRVNDAEQGLIMAGRYLRSEGCMVEYIAHTGKENARKKTSDQYSSRAGSAFPDGSRLVRIVHGYNGTVAEEIEEWAKITGHTLTESQSGIVIFVGKNTWGRDRAPIHILRDNWSFEMLDPETIEIAKQNYEEDKSSRRKEAEAEKELIEMQALYDTIKTVHAKDPEKSMSVNRIRSTPDEDRPELLRGAGYQRLKRIWDSLAGYGYIECKTNEKGNHVTVTMVKRPDSRPDLENDEDMF